jgi:hypothetical protein
MKVPIIPDQPLRVTFSPVKEDYIYISRVVSQAASRYESAYLYWAFLILNGICFPAYLIFTGYLLAGLSIFALNAVILIILIPENEKKRTEKFYDSIFKHTYDYPIEIDVTAYGLLVKSDGDQGLIGWKNITAIQESRDAIYFFDRTTGVAVRKSAFMSDDHQARFIGTAREYVRLSRLGNIESSTMSSTTN